VQVNFIIYIWKIRIQQQTTNHYNYNSMKKVLLFTAFLLVAGYNFSMAQSYQLYPIPSYNTLLLQQNNVFRQTLSHAPAALREKREMDVVISSSSTSFFQIYAKVWVVKDNGVIVKGPFIIFPNQLLEVPIDNGKWRAIIECTFPNVCASVWID